MSQSCRMKSKWKYQTTSIRARSKSSLEAEKQKARAEFQKRVTEIDRQIQSLLAIEHEVPT